LTSYKRYGYRSFDRQWCIADNRVGDNKRPELWAVESNTQIYLVSDFSRSLGLGPAAVVSAYVPDLDFLHGRGGKDVIPLYRDKGHTPNVNLPALQVLSDAQGRSEQISPEDLFAYSYGLLAGSDYTARFRDELAVPGPRIPITKDVEAWENVVSFGRDLIAVHTFGARRLGSSINIGDVMSIASWTKLPTRLPLNASDFELVDGVLRVADGLMRGVNQAALDFEVSGMNVFKKWLGFRTAQGTGRAAKSASALDQIRPESWTSESLQELTELLSMLEWSISRLPYGTSLLSSVLESDLVKPEDIPAPDSASLRGPGRIETGPEIDMDL
jgi:hypothetical protein